MKNYIIKNYMPLDRVCYPCKSCIDVKVSEFGLSSLLPHKNCECETGCKCTAELLPADHLNKIVFVLGPTGAGKSTFLRYALNELGSYRCGLIQVGKILRAKYPPEYFEGQAAPQKTADEAWALFLSELKRYKGFPTMEYIFVDGQPRSVEQARKVCQMAPGDGWKKAFLCLSAGVETRHRRLVDRDGGDNKAMKLALSRLAGDLGQLSEVLRCLVDMGQTYQLIDTNGSIENWGKSVLGLVTSNYV